jgi:fermentation-respiration switch protein FrsA (DUF1100 family)
LPQIKWRHRNGTQPGIVTRRDEDTQRHKVQGTLCCRLVKRPVAKSRESLRRESLIAVLRATTSDTFSGMQLTERPGPPGPYAAPDAVTSLVWGESAGGHLAAFIALNGNDERLDGTVGVTGCSSDVVAGVAWYPDTDFLALGPGSDRTGSPDPTSPEALLIGGPTRDRREDAAFASPVTHVHPGAAPILLVHGLEDGLLPPEQSALMHEALQTVGATSEVEWIEGADHVFFGVDPDPIADRSADFLVRHLA